VKRILAAFVLFVSLAAAQAPTPEAFFGHRMGADYKVLDWQKVVDYFGALQKGSPRVQVREYGRSTENRPMIVATISAPETMRRLGHFEQIQKRLADPRSTTPEQARALVAEGKTVVLITCSVHATEIGSTPAAVEFAYRLATSNDPKILEILRNTIVLISPTINPDGLDLVTKWYRRTLGTPFEGTSPPELYQKYVGHDNNRDWYFFTQAETRAVVSGLHNVWHPQIVYDLHQMGLGAARMFVPPWLDPIEPNIDPLIAQQCNMVGMLMATDLTAAGRKGIAVNAMYDYWTPARHYQSYHGGLRILSESASVRIASPVVLAADQLNSNALGYSPRERSWNHLEPWQGGEWHLRDIVDDMVIAMQSVCTTAAWRRTEFLTGFYEINRRATERTAPYAYVIPAAQADAGAARRLLETLAFGLVEIDRAREAFTANGKSYAAGSYVVRLRQPFSSFAKTLLEPQHYPDLRQYPGGPPKRPYDVTAHTLPLLMGVDAELISEAFTAKLDRVREFPFATRGWAGSDSDSWRHVNAAWREGKAVWRNPKTGDFVSAERAPAGFVALKRPRVGLYQSTLPAMDEGWTRWTLEHFGWEFSRVTNATVRGGRLREQFDVLLFADQTAAQIHNGYRKGSMPDEYCGGLGDEGAAALKEFSQAGGRLVFLNDSAEYAIEHLGLSVSNTLKGVASRDFYCPGSLLRVEMEPASPLALGLPPTFTIWNEQSPVFEATEGAVVRYAPSNVLASGWLLGEKYLAGKPALVDLAVGDGRVMLFGMRPQYRAQSWLTLKLLFNALAR
jgi:hypothetical protein